MSKRMLVIVIAICVIATIGLGTAALAAASSDELVDICTDLYGSVFAVPNGEPLAGCQWDMAIINASDSGSYAIATGKGVTVGVIDSGVDLNHPDIAPNLDVDRSCSFIFDDTPTANPAEIANGDCTNKAAVQDLGGHGTHVASTIAAPINGIGIAGVAPEATIVALKACTEVGYCFADSVAAALRYAGDQQLDVVNLSLFADPYLYYCKSDAEQRAILKDLEAAARYAQQRGVLVVASAGNQAADLQHPGIDDISPDWPPGSEEIRDVQNNCRVAVGELPGVMTVSATGPIGYPDYDLWIADYSSVGMSRVDVTAPGGDYFRASGTVQDAVLGAVPFDSDIWHGFDPLNAAFPGITVIDQGAGYVYLNGTSMSSPHAAGVAALVKEKHPTWGPGAVKAAVERSAQQLACPPDWEPLNAADERERCYGNQGRTSFFGHGLVDAAAAASVEDGSGQNGKGKAATQAVTAASVDTADFEAVSTIFLPLITDSSTQQATVDAAAAKPQSAPGLSTLDPGGFHDIAQDLTINVVFVGYEMGADINPAAFLADLPATYRTVNRYPSFYQGNEYLGLTFNYDYNLVDADISFEDAFFGYLSGIANPQPLTIYQAAYNTQAARSLDVVDNHWIDAPSVEQWLADHSQAMLGVDTSDYTIFFVNWYGREDFKHHVYTKTDEPDPDTGYNFGLERDSRKLIAWGGTTPDDEENGLGSLHRIWFYDLSAGPEGWTDNWNLDTGDLDGNGAVDVRMPPSWEYGNLDAYRPFDNLSGDLSKVTRYVALDLLFTTSPLYKPAISPPGIPKDIQLDINVYQIDPNDDGTAWFDLPLITDELNELQPQNTYSAELNSIEFTSRFASVYQCFFDDVSCFGNRLFGIAFADLYLYFNDQLNRFLEGDGDYEIPVFAFNATDELFTCCLGFADDNWADGTQSFVFAFDAPFIRDASGYGFSTTTIHEVGHHVGMSHPHDGYDYEADVDFGPSDDYYFAWSGDESNSMMSYIDLNWDFSQFDRDNMNRYMTSVYINQSNTILHQIYVSPKAGQVSDLLLSADHHATMALAEYATMNYAGAAFHAQKAYEDVVAAAAAINIQIEPQGWPADYKAKGKSAKFVDSADYQRNKP